jgi:hypothetical protein
MGLITTIKEKLHPSNSFIWIVILIGLVLFYLRDNYTKELEKTQLLEQKRQELIDLRFRESEIQQQLLCDQEERFLKIIKEIKQDIKYVPYEKTIYRYYNADTVLHILNSARY